jgi:autophagy-related protein 9
MLYQLKFVIFIEEILSMITTPFVLWFSLPKCSDRLIDFVREFTVHVDGIGYVCSFAVFDFKKGGNVTSQARAGDDLRDDYFSTKDGKMLASYYGFMDNYATNPRGGAPYIHRSPRRRFHPPPSFHELASPFPADMGGTGSVRQDRWDRQPQSAMRPLPGTVFGHQSTHRTPRFGAIGAQSSPPPSMLLDPHHQPSTSGFRSISRTNTQSRYRQARHPMTDTIEDEEEEAPTQGREAGGAGSGEGLADESNLGESWKTTRAGAVENDEDEEDGQEAVGEKGAGVLGLIYQFQKAQTDGRGAAGVSI